MYEIAKHLAAARNLFDLGHSFCQCMTTSHHREESYGISSDSAEPPLDSTEPPLDTSAEPTLDSADVSSDNSSNILTRAGVWLRDWTVDCRVLGAGCEGFGAGLEVWMLLTSVGSVKVGV